MKLALERRIQLAFIFALLLLLTLGFFAYRSATSMTEALNWEKHTQNLLLKLNDTLVLATDVENGGRGFVITGNESFLEPFNQSEQKIEQKLSELRQIATDNPKQTAEIAKLEDLIKEKIAFTKNLIETRRNQGLQAAAGKIESGLGKKMSDDIRLSIARMKDEERSLLTMREDALNKSIGNTLFILFGGTFAGIISLGLANFAIFREVRKRRVAEEEIRVTNQDLEKRVKERTREISQKNEELQDQIKQREQAEYRRRVALEAGSLGTWILDPKTDKAEIDDLALSLFGISAEDFDGSREKAFSKIHEEDFPIVHQLFEKSLTEHGKFNAEFRVLMPDGTIRWNHCTGQPLLDENNEIIQIIGNCRDITEYKLSETSLRQSEQRIRRVIDNLFSFVGVLSPEGILLEANKTALQAASLTAEDVVGKHFSETYWWSYSEETQNQLSEAIKKVANGESVRYDVNVQIGENQFIPIDFMLAPLFDDDGNVTQLIPSGLDLSPRKQAEDALRRSESFARTILDSLSAHIAVVDKKGNIVAVNQGWQQFAQSNCVEEQIGKTGVGQNYLEVCEAAARQENTKEIIEKLRQVLKGEKSGFNHEYPCHSPTEARWFMMQVNAMTDEEGGAVISHINITDRKLAEDALRQNKEQLDFTLEVAQLGVWRLDLSNQKASRSLRHDQIFGYEELLPEWNYEMFLDHVLQEDRAEVDRNFQEAIKNGTQWNFETRIQQTNGEIKWIWGRGQLQRDKEEISKMLGTVADITERKSAEQEREELLKREQTARKDAEIANRLRDEFLATVSHELRAPLNSILGWGRLLEKGKLDVKTAEKAIITIVRNAEAQNRLIEDLLDVSRIISGKLRLEVITIKPINIVESALETVRPAAQAKSISLEIKEISDVSHISGDPNRLQQVIWNLLSNAIKFTPNGGTVSVEIQRTNGDVEISVKDTGVGIKNEFLPHVFERFRQADASSIRKFGGLGLGLAIVRHLIEMHGGTVRAESAGENQGASFIIRLPVIIAPTEKENEIQQISRQKKQKSIENLTLDGLLILIVDDDEDTRQLLTQSLTFHGASVISANSAATALAQIEEKNPDVLVSDIGMPDEDGYSLIRKVRTLPDEHQRKIPAVALTAFTRAQDRMRALSTGFQNHVSKPVEPDELATVIASLTGRLQIDVE